MCLLELYIIIVGISPDEAGFAVGVILFLIGPSLQFPHTVSLVLLLGCSIELQMYSYRMNVRRFESPGGVDTEFVSQPATQPLRVSWFGRPGKKN